MHELAITKNLVEVAAQECRSRRIDKASLVRTELGSLTTYKKDPIKFYFNILKREHAALERARIAVKEVPGIVECRECGRRSRVTLPYIIMCGFCESSDVDVVQGKDFKITEIIGDGGGGCRKKENRKKKKQESKKIARAQKKGRKRR